MEDLNRTLQVLRRTNDFADYLRLLKKVMSKYMVIITVKDTGAGPYYTPEEAKLMEELGLKINMLKSYRQPYIAIIYRGNVVEERTSQKLNEPLISKGKINEHEVIVYSAGFDYQVGVGMGALVMFDGANFAPDRRGFNFFVYDEDNDEIIDSRAFDTFDAGKCIHRVNDIEPALKSFSAKISGGGAILCALTLPRQVPDKHFIALSKWEQFIIHKNEMVRKNGLTMWGVPENRTEMKEYWDKKVYPFCNDYKSFNDFCDTFTAPPSYLMPSGVRRFLDQTTDAVNTQNGIRVTTDQPQNHKRAIFFVGPCTLYGWGADDAHTIPSLLQKKLNLAVNEKEFIVYNYSYILDGKDNSTKLAILKSLPLKYGDIVFYYVDIQSKVWGIPNCDLTYKAIRPHNYGEIHTDYCHFTHSGNQMIADGIIEFLQGHNYFEDNLDSSRFGEDLQINENADDDPKLAEYKNKLRKFYREEIGQVIGAIVMNCNPFTLGHRYLVEEALKECDKLVVFVVEEDKSEFSFADRFKLVKENLADLKNVSVLPSSEFIISTSTFAGYFSKETLQNQKVDTTLDVTIFAKEIAPCLNITVRFAGEEPLDNVTKQYNESMAKILPQYGIKFVEIPRLKLNDTPISASNVRKLLKSNDFDKLSELVPPVTLEYLKKCRGK